MPVRQRLPYAFSPSAYEPVRLEPFPPIRGGVASLLSGAPLFPLMFSRNTLEGIEASFGVETETLAGVFPLLGEACRLFSAPRGPLLG